MLQKALGILVVLVALLTPVAAPAIVLDWDLVSWTAGSLNNSYDVDPAKAGNDITVSIASDTGQLVPRNSPPNPQTPAITNGFQGGLATSQNTLTVAVDLANQGQFLTFSVNFSSLYAQGVNNVSFTVFDVDFRNFGGADYQDQLRGISALSIDGVTLIAPTIVASSSNTLTGSGLNQVVSGNADVNDTGAGSGNGNVTINFGTTAIKSFSFIYGSGSGTIADPTYQHIALHDISFTAVPEINPAWIAALSCFIAGGLILRHRANVRR